MTIPVFQYLRQGFGENRVECTNSLASACASPACPLLHAFRCYKTRASMALMCDSHGGRNGVAYTDVCLQSQDQQRQGSLELITRLTHDLWTDV